MLPALEHLPSDLISWAFARPAPWKKSSPIPPVSLGDSADTPHSHLLHIVVTFKILSPEYCSILILLYKKPIRKKGVLIYVA